MMAGYADLIVMRHSKPGAVQVHKYVFVLGCKNLINSYTFYFDMFQ